MNSIKKLKMFVQSIAQATQYLMVQRKDVPVFSSGKKCYVWVGKINVIYLRLAIVEILHCLLVCFDFIDGN